MIDPVEIGNNRSTAHLDKEGHIMKSITGYVNQRKLKDLVRHLQNVGVKDVDVIEYCSQPTRISHIRLLCQDDTVERVCSLMVKIAGTGTACDHCLRVSDVGFNAIKDISLERSKSSVLAGDRYAYTD